MTLAQIREVAALKFGDPNMRHVTSPQWQILINTAQNEMCRYTKALSSWVDCGDFEAGVSRYSMAKGGFFGEFDIIEVNAILLDGMVLRATKEHLLEERNHNFRNAAPSGGFFWFTTEGDQIEIVPTPEKVYDGLTASIVHLPTEVLSEDEHTPEIPALFHNTLSLYACWLASNIDRDPDRGRLFAGLLQDALHRDVVQWKNRGGDVPIDIPVFVRFGD